MARDQETEEVLAAPYLSFTTFKNALDKLKEHDVPTQLDNNYLYTFLNGSNARLFIAALKFFDLIDGDRQPNEKLERLATDIDERKALLKELLRSHYPDVFRLDLERATNSQLDRALDSFKLSGDSKRKAQSFFVHACQYAGIPISRLITERSRTVVSRKQRKPSSNATAKATSSPDREVPTTEEPPSAPPAARREGAANTKTISLRSGGSVTLTVETNWFDVEPDERDFVLELIDKLKDYEQQLAESEDEVYDDDDVTEEE